MAKAIAVRVARPGVRSPGFSEGLSVDNSEEKKVDG